MHSTPWYTILSNPYYAEAFGYVPPYVKNRVDYIKDCDLHDDNHESSPSQIFDLDSHKASSNSASMILEQNLVGG